MHSNSILHVMAGLDKAKHPIRPGSSSSDFILLPWILFITSIQSHVPPPNPCSFPATGPCTLVQRPRHGHHHLHVAEEVIPLYLKLRCSQLLIRAMACGSKPTRSSVRWRLRRQAVVSSVATAGFVGIQTRKPNRIGSRDDAQYRPHD